jgi:hypothetical protein
MTEKIFTNQNSLITFINTKSLKVDVRKWNQEIKGKTFEEITPQISFYQHANFCSLKKFTSKYCT